MPISKAFKSQSPSPVASLRLSHSLRHYVRCISSEGAAREEASWSALLQKINGISLECLGRRLAKLVLGLRLAKLSATISDIFIKKKNCQLGLGAGGRLGTGTRTAKRTLSCKCNRSLWPTGWGSSSSCQCKVAPSDSL